MKLAFLSTILGYPWGGADALWTAAANHAADRGDRLHIEISELVAPHARMRELAAKGARIHVRAAPGRRSSLWRRLGRRVRRRLAPEDGCVRRLRAFDPGLVVLSCGGTWDAIAEPGLCRWLEESRVRYRIVANFQFEHPGLAEPDRERARRLLTGAERLYFVSRRNLEITRRELLDPLPRAECIHGCSVHNPIVPPGPVEWPAAPPWALASISRLEPVKGIDLLIAALAEALADSREWRLTIYGRGPQLPHLQRAAEHFGLGERIRFPGFVADLGDIWRESHLLVSTAIDEGVPITLPEALLRARPVLATRVGAADEWIEDGRTGFICPAPTVELIAATLREAWRRRTEWREMGAEGARRARQLYRPDDFAKIVAP